MISLDTNVVLRFLLGDVADQTKKATDLVENNTVYVTDVVVIEILYVLEKIYELSRKDICALVASFLKFSNVIHNPRFLLKSIGLYESHPALSIVDCYACEEAKGYGNELVTLDRRLTNQGEQYVQTL